MASYSDNFNRANGAIGSAWTNVNSANYQIVSNEVRQQTSGGAYRMARYESNMDSGNYSVFTSGRCADGGSGFGVCGRMTTSGTASTDIDGYVLIGFVGDVWYLLRMDNGAEAAYLDTGGSCAASTTYALELRMNGTTIEGYVNSSLVVSATDATYSTGRAGMITYGGANSTNAPYFDNWSAADVGGATYNLTANVAAATATPNDVSVSVSRSLAANVAAASATPDDVVLSLAATYNLSASIAAATATPDIGLAVTRALSAAAAASTATPDVSLAVTRALSANVAAASATGGAAGYRLLFAGTADDRVDRAIIPQEGNAINVGGDMTYECMIQCAYADNATTATDVRYSNIIIDHDVWGDARGWCLGVTRRDGALVLIFGAAGDSWAAIRGTANVGDGLEHYIAMTRNGTSGQVRLWLDGEIEASGTFNTGNWAVSGSEPEDGLDNFALVIGCEKHDYDPGVNGYTGYFDNLRVSDTVRYTSTYTPALPTVDGDTVGLYLCNEGSGTTLTDASGNQNGTILYGTSPVAPTWEGNGEGDVRLTVARSLTAATSAATATPDITLSVLRALSASIATTTATADDVVLTIEALIALAASIAVATATPDIALTVSRNLSASVDATTVTPDIALTVARSLAASIAAASATPDDVTLSLAGLIELAASIAAATNTSDIALTVARSIASSIDASTVTPEVVLSVLRSAAAQMAAQTTTPDIALSVLRSLTSSHSIVTETGDVSLTVLRSLAASIEAQTATGDVDLSTGIVVMGLLSWVVSSRAAGATAAGRAASVSAAGRAASLNAEGDS